MTLSNTRQLVLGFALNHIQTFESYFAEKNTGLMNLLIDFSCSDEEKQAEWFVFVSGAKGVGKSHLLNAVCVEFEKRGKTVALIPLEAVLDHGSELLDGYSGFNIIAIDDVHLLQGRLKWQEAFFHLHNALQVNGGKLLMSSAKPLNGLDLELADLKSRMAAAVNYNIQILNDELKQQWFGWELKRRGIAFDEALLPFLLSRISREMPEIKALIDRLDEASLREKRSLTIPFARQVLSLG